MKKAKRSTALLAVIASTLASSQVALANLSFTVDANGWDSTGRRDAAVWALGVVTARYNAYGDFGNYNVWAYYSSGIPTAQASYLGSIGYGGTWPNERVTLHESNHYLGSGTYAHTYDNGPGLTLLEQFDGIGSRFGTDGTHFWGYGLNYDSEFSEVNAQRNVALMYGLRKGWGIGSTANPTAWNATSVTMTGSDSAGQSGFNWATRWSDNTFAHPNADYATGANALRTPNGYANWTFAGKSLTVSAGGSLFYNGYGTAGVVSFKQLNVNGGTIKHDQFPQDVFQLAGRISSSGNNLLNAANGPIKITAPISGSGSFQKLGAHALTLTGPNTYTGNTTITAGVLRLGSAAPIANYTFDNVSGSTVNNDGTGGSGMNGTLTGGATIVAGGQTGNALNVSGGASVNINNGVTDLSNSSAWTVSAWIKTTTAGSTLLSKSDNGWSTGNTIMYLGDGTGGGSGGIPSAVRYAGGFVQGSASAANVANGQWRHVTYTNNGGDFAIYVDGVLQPLSAGNSAFAHVDFGGLIKLGATTNTIAGDGTLNFNGQMDNVRIYNQSLSPAQVTALYQGKTLFGSLPATTNVSITSGATLDLGGAVQQIGSLNGAATSAIAIGSGQLIVNSSTDSSFSGQLSGAGGSLVKAGTGTLTLNGANSYTGATTISGGTLRLAAPVNGSVAGGAVAAYSFDSISGSTVVNSGFGGSAMNGALAGGATIVAGGRTGSAVSLAGGATVNINNGITDLGSSGDWTVTSWVKTTTAGGAILTKSNGSTWASGNTSFYLGDGSAAGSGGIAGAVRYAGGFYQASPSAPSVIDGVWHQVTYVNQGGVYRIYVDGVLQSLSPGNAGFSNPDVGTVVKLGSATGVGDGAVNFNGLLDDVQFYGRALSAEQITALFGGLTLGPLPTTTALQIDGGATLDVNGVVQQVASVNGAVGSTITLGTGRLIVSNATANTFAGAISGTGGSFVKQGAGTLTLSGANTYTGGTLLQGGTLVIATAAQNPILVEDAGVDLQAGTLVFDYTDGSTPAASVLSILDAGFDEATKFSAGKIRSTTLAAGNVLGWLDDTTTSRLTVRATVPGDSNLDLSVNFDDLLALAQNYSDAATDRTWQNGDFNYDGMSNFDDLLALAQHYGTPASFASDWALAQSLVPEPTALVPALLLVGRRRRRH